MLQHLTSVPKEGFEPPRPLQAPDPKSGVSTSFTIQAFKRVCKTIGLFSTKPFEVPIVPLPRLYNAALLPVIRIMQEAAPPYMRLT